MRREVEVIEVRPTGPVAKIADPWGTKASKWRFPIDYMLADGTTEASNNTFDRKRDAIAALAKLPAPPTHPTAVCYDEHFPGRFSVRTTIRLGGYRA